MKLFFTFISLLITLTTGAQAEVKLKDYETARELQEFKTYIDGVGVGFGWANMTLKTIRKQAPLYCPPEKPDLGVDNFLDILDRTINKRGTILGPDTPVEALLLSALIETFPCRQ